eukprot:6029086-Prorocentrum_lima.AAC.1
MQDLAENAMALPTWLAVLMSSMSASPWKDRSASSAPFVEPSMGDADDALDVWRSWMMPDR